MMVNELNTTFKKVILLSVLTVLAGVGVVYALGYEFKPKNSTQTFPTAEGVNEQFKLTMQLEKTNYSLGEPINVTLILTNISNKTITFFYWAGTFDFLVCNDTNNVIYQWARTQIFPFVGTDLSLNPQEDVTKAFVWPQRYGTPPFSEGSEGDPVSPGTYYIVGRAGALQTTPIQVTIIGS